jgi:hypothetical protein
MRAWYRFTATKLSIVVNSVAPLYAFSFAFFASISDMGMLRQQ